MVGVTGNHASLIDPLSCWTFYVLHSSPIFVQLTCMMCLQSVKNSVGSDQLVSKKPADLVLHCYQNMLYLGLEW